MTMGFQDPIEITNRHRHSKTNMSTAVNRVLWLFVPMMVVSQKVSPQFIFNATAPPEFPNCDAKFAGVCAVQVSMGLLNKVKER